MKDLDSKERKEQMERDPLGRSAKDPGAKLDAGKSPIWQGVLDYFPRAVAAVADLSAYGANKYSWKGWESVPNGENRYGNAAARHIVKEAIEGLWDKDIENDPNFPACVLHATQQVWNAMARLELMLRRMEQVKQIAWVGRMVSHGPFTLEGLASAIQTTERKHD